MSLAYRPDVDGLRAVAVGSVVLFHGHIPPFTGGFVGVDVFFVISGFLITSILARDIAAKRFSLVDFYDRRIRRIFPALFLVLAATTGLAAVVLMPGQMVAFARALPASAFFFANLHFADSMGYFGRGAEEMPLLHLWSLAVEEQFYIVFPLLLFALMRLGGRARAVWALVAIALASLAFSQIEVGLRPQQAFYLLSTRAWELLAGALLALAPPVRLGPRSAGVLGLAGLAGIVLPVLLYHRDTSFPGLAALPPVLGAAAVILAGACAPHGPSARLLSLGGFVYAGRISYSLYLWHWPLLVLAALYKGAPLTHLQSGGLILLALVLSALSLKYVELPFRLARPGGRRVLARFGAAAAVMVATVLVALGIEARGAGLWRNTPRGLAAEAVAAELNRFQRDCATIQEDWRGTNFKPLADCALGQPGAEGRYDVLVWGDSHALALFPAVGGAVERAGGSARVMAMVSCPPLIGGRAANATESGDGRPCVAFNAAVMDEIRQVRPKLVVLVGRWSLWTRHAGATLALVSDAVEGGTARTHESSRRVFAAMLDQTLTEIEGLGARVLLVEQVPEYGFAPPDCVAHAEFRGRDASACLGQPIGRAMAVAGEGNALLAEAQQRHPSVTLLPLPDIFCHDGSCKAGAGTAVFYADNNHISAAGVRLLENSPVFTAAIDAALDADPGAALWRVP